MELVKWEPFKELEALDDRFERVWRDVVGQRDWMRPVWDDRNREATGWRPAVNVFEDTDKLYIEAQVPGIEMKDVEITVKDHSVQIRGLRKMEHEDKKEGYHFIEATYGTFGRTFSLPPYVDPDQAKATYDKGVLTVAFPKREEAKPRKITIESK